MEQTDNAALPTAKESPAAKEFYSLEEVAELLGVNYQLIYKLVRAGDLPSARIGKVYRVMRVDLDGYLQRSKAHSGGTCSVCGNTYHSKLSLKNSCVECGEPICVDCWTRQNKHACPAHAGAAAVPAKDSETRNN
jgi:excisionase family DNA binding protein